MIRLKEKQKDKSALEKSMSVELIRKTVVNIALRKMKKMNQIGYKQAKK